MLRVPLGVLFFVSGVSSLFYQVAWQRVFSLYYGVGPISATIVVSAFMLGLGAGGLAGSRYVREGRANLRLYMLLEIAIGLFGLVSLPLLTQVGIGTAGESYPVAAWWTFLLLCIPTLLMGMTLPIAIALLTSANRRILQNVSYFYFLNTLGASIGAASAGFIIIGWIGLDGAIYVAAALNFGLALAIFSAVRRNSQPIADAEPTAPVGASATLSYRQLLPAAFVSGSLAIGYEILWFRITSLLLKDSPYAFSITLSVYLLGIAVGSYLCNFAIRKRNIINIANVYFTINGSIALCTLLIFLGIFWGATLPAAQNLLTMLQTEQFMIIPIVPETLTFDDISLSAAAFVIAILVPVTFMFIPACFMGSCFPLVASLSPQGETNPTAAATKVYFCLVLGNVFGGILTGFVLLPVVGTENTLRIFILIGIGFLLFGEWRNRAWRIARTAILVASIVAVFAVFPGRGELISALHVTPPDFKAHISEGIDGIVLTDEHGPNVNSYINGSGHGFRPNPNFYLETSMALSYSKKQMKNVLIVGIGGASSLEAALKDPSVGRVTLVEINGSLIANLLDIKLTRDLLLDPRVTLVHDDARRWLYSHAGSFDFIMLDPLRTSSAYSNNIYSKEFFELLLRRMAHPAWMLMWSDEFLIIPRTLASVFPAVDQYCFFMVAGNDPSSMNEDSDYYQSLISRFTPDDISQMSQTDCKKLGDRNFTLSRTVNFPINSDLRPYTEYYLTSRLKDLIDGVDPLYP